MRPRVGGPIQIGAGEYTSAKIVRAEGRNWECTQIFGTGDIAGRARVSALGGVRGREESEENADEKNEAE